MSDESKPSVETRVAAIFIFIVIPSVLGSTILWGFGAGMLAFPIALLVGCVFDKYM